MAAVFSHQLPGEVRNMILRLCLVSVNTLVLTLGAAPSNFASLLLLNRATHAEAQAIFWQENVFEVASKCSKT